MANDMDAYSQAVSGFNIRPRVLSSGPIAVVQDSIDLKGVVIRFTRYKGHLLEEYLTDPDWLTLAFLSKPIRWCGHHLPASTAITLLPSREGIATISGSLELLEFSYSEEAVAEAGLDLDTLRCKTLWQGLSYLPFNTTVMAWASRLLYGQHNLTQISSELRERLLEYLVQWFSTSPYPHRVAVGSQRLEITQAVMDLIEAHPERFLTMEELSSRLGVTERWVRRSFKSTIGMNVYEYAREMKLGAANDMLTKGTHTVTSVASRLGFNHLSRFSQYYQARFGELPVQTLRRV